MGLEGVMLMETSVADVTVSVADPVAPWKLAVMFAVPKLKAVAMPVLLTRATSAADELQITCEVRSRVLLSLKIPVAVNCMVPLMPTVGDSGTTTMEVNVAGLTVRSTLPVREP